MLSDIPVRLLMTSPAITLVSDDPFSKVEEMFRRKGIRHLPIVDHQKKVIGLLTQRDLYRTIKPHRDEEGNVFYDPDELNEFLIPGCMAHNPKCLTAEAKLSEAVRCMAEHKYGCIPIIHPDGTCAGILTETDILKYLAKQFM